MIFVITRSEATKQSFTIPAIASLPTLLSLRAWMLTAFRRGNLVFLNEYIL